MDGGVYTNTTFDDGDPIAITYVGKWSHLTFDNSDVKDGTLSESSSVGSSMWAGFPAVQVWVYGSIIPASKTATPVSVIFALTPYDKPNAPVATGSFTAPVVTAQQNNVLLWYSGIVPPQGAWFTMNVTSASANNPYVFDYLVWNEEIEPPHSIAVTTSSLTNALTLSSTPTTQSPSTTPSPSGPPQIVQGSGSHNHTGAIVGGVVGGVVAAVILLVALFWCRRRHARSAFNAEEADVAPANATSVTSGLTPYMLPRDHNSTSADVVPPERAGPITPARAGIPVMASVSKARLFASDTPIPSSSGSSAPTTDGASSSSFSQLNLPAQSAAQPPVLPPPPVIEEFPPMYTPA